MKKIFSGFQFFLLFTIFVLSCSFDPFSDSDNPSVFYHVDVVSGFFILNIEDNIVQSPSLFAIERTYISSGALEKEKENQTLESLQGTFPFRRGWSFLPHLYMLIEKSSKGQLIYVNDKQGNMTIYEPSEDNRNHYKIKEKKVPNYTSLNGKFNVNNNQLILLKDTNPIQLILSDGTICEYNFTKHQKSAISLCLKREILPNKHQIIYEYDKKDRLLHIEFKNPSSTKTYGWIHFDLWNTYIPFHYQIRTSDNKRLEYKAIQHENESYLTHVINDNKPEEKYGFLPSRKKCGLRLYDLYFNNKLQFQINYYTPENKRQEQKWAYDSKQIELPIDKVRSIEVPSGIDGQIIKIADYKYFHNCTEIRDAENILRKYHHENGFINLIEYYDKQDQLYSKQIFNWENDKLKYKVFCDKENQAHFAKSFQYDSCGNVLEEITYGNFSGELNTPFSCVDSLFTCGEQLKRTYEYLPIFHVPTVEKEGNGLVYRYYYKPDTNLLTHKYTYENENILLREFYIYDEDNILIEEIHDDANCLDPEDFQTATERHIKRYEIHPNTGMILSISELFWSIENQSEQLLKRTVFSYSDKQQIVSEKVYDSNNRFRYEIFIDYDSYGRIIKKTTPTGRENIYLFDELGNLIENKEPLYNKKRYSYTSSNTPFSCTEYLSNGQTKTSYTHYDIKGRLIESIDNLNNSTKQYFDSFGRCLKTQYPCINVDNNEIQSSVNFSYDVEGNIISHSDDLNNTYYKKYNIYKKPTHIIQPDNTEIIHSYNLYGDLICTIYPDKTKVIYEYDVFHRKTAKIAVSTKNEKIELEKWVYSSFHLTSHTNEEGLTTCYEYDGAGRLIKERSGNRIKYYEYDALGFLQTVIENEIIQKRINNEEGQIIEQWEEQNNGNRENWMEFTYDEKEGRKILAKRLTSNGIVSDYFSYDEEGRLDYHKDPENAETYYKFCEKFHSDLKQNVLEKKIIDPLKNITDEIQNSLGHIIRKEKIASDQKILFSEDYYYDSSGNRIKMISKIPDSNKEISILWEYDCMGRMTKQIEPNNKITSYRYDCNGRVIEKILPNGISISYKYDFIDRMIEQSSSDGSIHYKYQYHKGNNPINVIDLIGVVA